MGLGFGFFGCGCVGLCGVGCLLGMILMMI
jgi:hypothetical protein